MRPIMLLAPIALLVSACAKSDTPAADTGAAMAMAPMMMMEADVAGSWTGTSMPEGSDSVVARWTQMCGGGTCKGTVEGMPFFGLPFPFGYVYHRPKIECYDFQQFETPDGPRILAVWICGSPVTAKY